MNVGSLYYIVQSLDQELVLTQESDFIIIKIDDIFSIFNNRSSIRSNKILFFPYSDNHWAPFSGSDKLIGMILIHNHNGISSVHFIQG
ncbi:hypothetical protein D9M68_467190 [compost metagenome]